MLPTARRMPADAGPMPAETAASTVKALSVEADAMPKKSPTANTRRGVLRVERLTAAADSCSRVSRAGGVTMPTAAAASAAPTKAHRQPTVRAMTGTASPPTREATGSADCLSPKARPCRSSAMPRDSDMFAPICPRPLATPATMRKAVSTRRRSANSAIASEAAAAIAAAIRIDADGPIRSASNPIGATNTAPAPR